MKQYVGNACGTIAICHCLLNNPTADLTSDSWAKTFLDSTKDKTPHERGNIFHDNSNVETLHKEFEAQGQSAAPDAQQACDTHFIAFILDNGNMYELDGRKERPINHGAVKQEELLASATKAIQSEFMAKDPEEVRFTMLALTPKE